MFIQYMILIIIVGSFAPSYIQNPDVLSRFSVLGVIFFWRDPVIYRRWSTNCHLITAGNLTAGSTNVPAVN